MPQDAGAVLDEATPRRELVENSVREAADVFHTHEGDLFERDEALALLEDACGVSTETAAALLAELTGDTVDPIVHVRTDSGRYYGVIDYTEFDGAYGYTEYDDVTGEHRRVVCAQCVNEATNDSDVTHATAGDPSGSFADQPDASYDTLYYAITQHYATAHTTVPDEVKTGASLASGTTIGGNESWHAGNDGSGSGLNADSLDGNDASHFLASADYNPESDTHSKYTDSEAISAIDGKVDAAATSVASLDDQVSTNVTDISNLQSNKLDASNYNPETDTHSKYTDSEAVSAVEATNIDFGSNQIQFQPASSGGSVEGIRFDSNVNSGSDYASLTYHDSYYSDSESGVLQLRVENDGLGGAGPDAVVLSGVGGTFIDKGGLYLDGVDLSATNADSVTQTIWDDSAGYITQASLENDTVTVAGNSVSLGNSTSVSHSDLSGINSDDHHSKYTDTNAVSAVNNETSLSVDISGDADSVDGYDVVKDGSDGTGTINLETASSTSSLAYADTDAIAALDGEVSAAASSVTGLDSQVSTNVSDISSLQSNKLDSSSYTPVSDVNNETSLTVDISGDSDSVDGYDIQKNGTDGSGIINFKT